MDQWHLPLRMEYHDWNRNASVTAHQNLADPVLIDLGHRDRALCVLIRRSLVVVVTTCR